VRLHRLALACLLGAVGVLIGTSAGYAADGIQLTAPNQIGPTTEFLVIFRYPRPNDGCAGGTKAVIIAWDQRNIATAGPRRLTNTTCEASAKITAPANDRGAGQHTLTMFANYNGIPTANKTITITGGGAQGQGGQATPTQPAPTNTYASDPALPADVASQPTVSLSPVVAAASGQTGSGGGLAINLLLVFGGVLLGGGALALGILIHRMRRPSW
jgi:hypothetical protein